MLKNGVQTCRDASIRWTDNLYEMESWMKKSNPGVTTEELGQNFPILIDLDYPPLN